MKELKSAYVCETHDHRRGPYSDLDDHLNLYTDIFSPKFLFAFSFHILIKGSGNFLLIETGTTL